MHRSGTSVLARLVGLMVGYRGVRGAADDNAEGHWEDPRVNVALEDCFRRRGHDWASPPLKPLVWNPATDGDARARLQAVIRGLGSGAWVMKDPRLCIALSAVLELEQPPSTVVATFRNPHEVASSLSVRDGYQYEYGLALWEVYTRNLVQQVVEGELAADWVSYETLMSSPQRTVERLGDLLRAAGYAVDPDAARRALGAINPALRHHEAPAPRTPLSDSQATLLALLTRASEGASITGATLPPLTGWAIALLETRRPYQRLERDNRLLVHRLRHLKWAYRAIDRGRRVLRLPAPEDPFMNYR